MPLSAVLFAGGRAMALDTPLVRAADAVALRSSADLLGEASRVAAEAHAQAADHRAAAEADGRQAALAEARDTVREAIASLSQRVDDALAERRADIAAAALAATRAILGTFDEAELVGRLADGVLTRAGADERVTVRVSPVHAVALRERLADRPFVIVEAVASAGPFDCSVQTGDGVVIASLPVQLAALADRWGVPA